MKFDIIISVFAFLFLVGCDVDDGSADASRGAVAMNAGDWHAAVKSYVAASDKNVTNVAYRVQATVAAFKAKEFDIADVALSEALALDPDSAELHVLLGQLCFYRGEFDKARIAFEAISGDETLSNEIRSEAMCDRAVTEYTADPSNIDAVRFALFRALRLNRRNAAVWYHLGVLSRDVFNATAAALEQFQMASRLTDPNDERTKRIVSETLPALRSAAAKSLVGVSGGESVKFEDALAKAKKLERAAKTKTDVDKALDAYRTALIIKPSSQATYLAAARLAVYNSRLVQAVKILDTAICHEPENKQAIDLMIEACNRNGDRRRAQLWQKYRKELR